MDVSSSEDADVDGDIEYTIDRDRWVEREIFGKEAKIKALADWCL